MVTWQQTIDFRQTQGGFVVGSGVEQNQPSARYVAGQGWQVTDWNESVQERGCRRSFVYYTFSAATQITRIDYEVLWENGNLGTGDWGMIVQPYSGADQVLFYGNATSGEISDSHNLVNYQVSSLTLDLRVATNPDDSLVGLGGDGYIRKVTLYGEGLNPFVVTDRDAPNHDGDASCPCAHAGSRAPYTADPLSLRTGEKTETVTDLRLTTPAGELAFTRIYRQAKHADYRLVGLGWWHNHALKVDDTTSNKLIVWLENGTQAHFTRVGTTNLYQGDPGSTAQIDAGGSGNAKYTLTAQDGSTYVFGADKQIRTRAWANGEQWLYSYYAAPHFAENLLQEVTDGYGRKLQFAYVNNSGQLDHLQLWRVGDQTASGLASGTPSGRYVEFSYVAAQLANTNQVVLSTVRDVRGEVWTYDWYGQQSGETDVNRANWLVRYTSPSVDVNGDGSADGSVTLKELSYTLSGSTPATIQQRLGKFGSGSFLQTVDYAFQPQGNNWTTEQSAGRTTTHYFAGGVYAGSGNDLGHLPLRGLDAQYRPNVQQDANGNPPTQLSWSSDGQRLNSVTDSLNHTTQFSYDSLGRLTQSTDAEQRPTFYIYDDLRRQPSLILTAQTLTAKAINGNMESNSGWSAVGSATHQQTTTQVESGTYAWSVNTTAADAGLSSVNWTQTSGHYYLVTARVYLTNGQARLQVGPVTVDSTTSLNRWQTLRLAYRAGATLANRQVQLLAQGGAATFYVDSVQVIELTGIGADALLRGQQLAYDPKGRTVEEATLAFRTLNPPADTQVLSVPQAVQRTYYTSGNGSGLLQTVTHEDGQQLTHNQTTTYFYDAAGRVQQVNQSAALGSCEKSFMLYDAAGNVEASICNYENTGAIPTTVAQCEALFNPSQPDQNQVTTHVYDTLGRRVKTTTNAGASYAQTSVTLYDALSRVTRTIGHYVAQGTSVPGDWVWRAVNNVWAWRHSASDDTLVSHGAENNQNIISDTGYNQRGLVRLRRDVLGNVTLYGYDDADRLIKTVQNAAQPNYNNDYSGTGADPDLSAYNAGSAVDQDFITEQAYDANGNLVMSQDLRGMRTFTVYDALNRPLKTVANAKAAATVLLKPGDSGYVAVNDPRSDGYARSTAPDRDQVTETKYDALGRVIRTRRLLENRESEQWDVTLYGYDALGRQVRVIQHTSQPAYNLGADPSLFVYPTVSNADQDHVTNTEYDAAGRVLHTIDVNGTKTRSVYDGLGRVVKTIANYVAQGSSDPAQWVWSSANNRWEDGAGNAIHHGTNFDQNIITETDYDADGRVDLNRTFQGLVSKSGYNARGRTVINVQNFVDNSYDPVNGWVWNGTQWVDHGTQSTPIARGVGYDQNIISGTEYDAQSRVLQTRDVRGHVTRFVYDTVGRRIRTITHYVPQGSSDPAMWVFEGGVWKQGAGGSVVSHGADNTQNLVSDTVYDVAGRVVNTRDTVGRVSRTVYDRAGRTTLRVQHYTATSDPVTWVWVETPTTKRWEDGNGNALTFGSQFDQNHVSQTEYNQSGQVSATRDTRGTRTTFGYDDAGRRVTITAAQGSGLDSTSYTCYDKAGRVLRTIQRYIPQAEITPDERANGQWVFKPLEHGSYNDENLSTEFTYDAASRRIAVISPTGNVSQTGYAKDGQVVSQTDPLGVVTHYSYDQLRRRVRVVQNYVAQGSSDPAQWVFAGVWKQSPTGANIAHGANSDQNIIVTLKHDAAGQMREMHDPRGNVTTYAYDRLGRRISATNPLSQAWLTAFTEVNQTTQTTQTYPNGYSVQRNFDPLGRLARIQYHDLPTTPDVQFAYDLVGQRTQMTEFGGANFTSPVRATTYGYDAAQRLTSVGYDTDGGGTVDETVSYTYDVGGLRMQLTLPGNLSITYQYDRQGRLIAATDWDSQRHAFSYDGVDRHVSTRRPNRLTSQYRYDVGGRLRQLRHHQHGKLLGQYDYTVDARGNRTQARELVRQPGSGTTTTTHTPNFDTTDRWGKLDVEIVGYEATITYGTHADGSYFDVYVNGSLWESFDGYSAADGEKSVVLRLTEEGRHTLSFRNRYDHAPSSTGYRMHIKTVVVTAHQYSNNVINYSYDQLARLIQAALVGGATYIYGYDLAGNLTNYNGTSRTFDAANRLSSATYDANGNMTSDGTNAYVWDRANRLLTVGNTEYRYNGDGNRISQTIGGIVTKYLLDTQPGLALVLAETTGSATTRYMHGLRGIHATEASTSVWTYPLQDGLGSVRNVVDTAGEVQQAVNYTPYGVPDSSMTGFAFTGEQRDPNGLQYHRARYYAPELGLWASLDPFEGIFDRPMSLNGYSWVEGNVPNFGDPTGAMPKKDEIESGRMRYSCNCGWLDAFHIMGGFTKSKFIREALSTSINWNNYDPSVEHGRFIYLHRSGGINVKVFQSPAEYTAYVPEEQATSHLEEVALGIYKGFENHFETLQSQANAFDGFMGDRASGFSIEDFPSDLVGYYIGKNDKSQSYHLDTSNQFEALWQTVESRTPCSIMNSEDSLYMLDQWRP